jgi:hypothetical protein
MKKFLFLLISLLVITTFSELTAKDDEKSLDVDTSDTSKKEGKGKKLEMDTSDTFKKDNDKESLKLDTSDTFKKDNDKKSLKFDADATLDYSNTNKVPEAVEKKIKELIKKDPKKAKVLLAKAKDVTQLLKEAQKFKDAKIAKACEKLVKSLETLAKYHDGKEVSDKQLYQAYNDCKFIKKDIKQIEIRIAAAKRNTPQAKKIRKFQRSAKNYLSKAKTASTQGYKAKAEYYKTCAQIKKEMAANPKIEAAGKERLKKAKIKYNQDAAKESAIRFRKRAEESREQDDNEKAQYYEKVATLKEKLSEAYGKNNKSLVKSLLKEYKDLQKTKK